MVELHILETLSGNASLRVVQWDPIPREQTEQFVKTHDRYRNAQYVLPSPQKETFATHSKGRGSKFSCQLKEVNMSSHP